MTKTTKTTKKFKALVHYIVHELRGQPHRLGAIRLSRTLWIIDAISYKMNECSLTGELYVSRWEGPVLPQIAATLDKLEDEGKILINEPVSLYDVRKYLSIEIPNAKHLSDDERELARQILSVVCDFSADEVGDLANDVIWRTAA